MAFYKHKHIFERPLEIKADNPKRNQSWIFIVRTDVEAETPILWPILWREELTHWERPWCWERLKVGGKGDDRGWDGWMASLTQRTWVWVNSRSWWWTGRPGVLQSMRSQRVGHDWASEQQTVAGNYKIIFIEKYQHTFSWVWREVLLYTTILRKRLKLKSYKKSVSLQYQWINF